MTFQGRREDPRLITGRGRYTDDVSLAGQLHGVFLRSDHAHGRIITLDTSAAAEAPGVVLVLTAAELAEAGCRRPVPMAAFPDDEGPLRVPEVPVLAADTLRYVGEPVALVVAETLAAARDALEMIELEVDALPAVMTPGAAEVALHDALPANLAFDYRFGDAAAVEAAFAEAAHLVPIRLTSDRVAGVPMEPKAVLARWEDETLDIWCPSQGSAGTRDSLAACLGVAPERVRPHADDVGGAFGVRGDVYPEYVAVALAAKLAGRPVKWLASRSETFLSDYQGRGIEMRAELALDDDGRFLALRHDLLADLGAYPSGAGPLTSVMNPALMAGGAYRIPAISGRVRLALTNRVPLTAYRGAARPEMAYLVERLVDEAARATGIDRIELRRRNMLAADAFPYALKTAPMPMAYDSGDFPRLVARGLAAAGWEAFPERRAAAEAKGLLRGIGCALFVEPAGGVSPSDEAAIIFGADGSITLHELAVASGQGHETVFPEIVAARLGIDPARITLSTERNGSPATKGAGAYGSRTLMSMGSVLHVAAGEVLEKARALAARQLDLPEDALDYAEGAFGARGSNRSIDLAELARLCPGALDTVAELPSPRAFPSGFHVAEVEIDPATGRTEVAAYHAVDDCGTVLNATLVEGQVWGGLLQGLGQVFGEICAYDEDGQLLSGTFMDYVMPRADLLKRVRLENIEVPSPSNILGAKGVGEAGTIGALPATMNAVADALARRGITGFDMPATPYRVWAALAGRLRG